VRGSNGRHSWRLVCHVAVPFGLVQPLASVCGVRTQEGVDLGNVHPCQQVRVGRRVRAAVGRSTGDVLVDGPDLSDSRAGIGWPAERRGRNEVARPPHASPRIALVRGVISDRSIVSGCRDCRRMAVIPPTNIA